MFLIVLFFVVYIVNSQTEKKLPPHIPVPCPFFSFSFKFKS